MPPPSKITMPTVTWPGGASKRPGRVPSLSGEGWLDLAHPAYYLPVKAVTSSLPPPPPDAALAPGLTWAAASNIDTQYHAKTVTENQRDAGQNATYAGYLTECGKPSRNTGGYTRRRSAA